MVLTRNLGKGIVGRRFLLAMLVILASFILIGYMLVQQNQMTEQFFNIIESKNFDNATSTNLIEAFEKIDKSNQTIFNIILPLLGAWVGVVIAFYFGSRNLDKAQEATEKAQEIISKLAQGKGEDITLEELLKLHPESKNVQIVELKDDVKVVEVRAKVFGNVVVVDEGKILGVLYLKDLEKAKEENGKKYPEDKLGKVLGKGKVEDHITGQTWKEKELVKENYARLSYQDKISEARTKMEQVKPEPKKPKAEEPKFGELDVLGLVFEKEKLEAVINYKTLLRYF